MTVDIEFEPAGPFNVKGRTEPIDVYHVLPQESWFENTLVSVVKDESRPTGLPPFLLLDVAETEVLFKKGLLFRIAHHRFRFAGQIVDHGLHV